MVGEMVIVGQYHLADMFIGQSLLEMAVLKQGIGSLHSLKLVIVKIKGI
jgi:hypothetical protein